ncbi:unnamed protein product [Scytosiphon promiscuus]
MEEYEPIKVLGEGSFGKVYLMKHSKTRDLVCTKVIKLKNIPPKEQEACKNEVELLSRMCHPNIVGYTNSFIYKNCLCIIMEYCDAGDLGDRVNEAKGQLLPESKVMTWFVQTALGLHFMHTNRVLHRDIKTQNVFILSSGRVVLGDLGISKARDYRFNQPRPLPPLSTRTFLLGGTRDFASTCIGTPYYMSPEIFKNHPYNDKSDVWALGCLLYELLTLKHAFDAQSLNGLAGKIIKGKFPSVSSQYSKNLRALVNDMLATNPKKRPDIEQILRKSFVQTRVKEFVSDLDADELHRQDKAMHALSDQLIDLKMDDAVPMENLIVEEGNGDEGPNAPSPSESDATAAAAAAAAASSKSGGSRSQLKAQKHQLELEEEKRIAAEMALNRLRRKAAERRRRASLSRAPGSPENGAGETGGSGGGTGDGSPSRGRRPSLLQRLGSLATSPIQSRRKSLSTPASPSGNNDSDSIRGSSGNKNNGSQSARAAGAGAGMSDVDKAMALAGPTGPPRQSLARPKEATDYVSNPTRRRSKGGVNSSSNSNNASGGSNGNISARSSTRGSSGGGGGGSPREGRGEGHDSSRKSQEGESSSSSPCRPSPDLPKLQLGSNASATPALRSGRSSADRSNPKSEHLFEEDDSNDLFHVLKEQAKAHAREGEDKEVHEREEELRAKLREAEQRCHELQESMEKVREAGKRRGSIAVAPPAAPAGPTEAPPKLNIDVNPSTKGSLSAPGGSGGTPRQSYSRSASSCSADDDRASDFEDEPVPYCQSHLEEIHDAPTPVGNLVDRVQFLTKKCTEGLGQDKFTKALDLLTKMQEGDCKVDLDGVVYDGNNDDDVERVLVKVIGKHKLHYWNLMDQLLLMS